jgi:hypothetical protein
MNQNGLGKLYDRLTPEERFKLDVEAMARGDKEESRRLVDTCPRRPYTMTDVRFAGRWDGAIQLSMAALMDLRPAVAKLRMIGAFRVTLPYLRTLWVNDTHEAYFDGHVSGSRHAWSKAGKRGAPPGWEESDEEAEKNTDPAIDEDLKKWTGKVETIDDRLVGALAKLERELAGEALVVWVAFSRLCTEEMGLSVEKILTATFKPALEDVAFFEEVCERLGLEADQAAVEECREALGVHWRRLLSKG